MILAIRQAALNRLRSNQRAVLRLLSLRFALGDGALYKSPTNAQWRVWADHRFTLHQVAVLGTVLTSTATIPAGWVPPDNRRELAELVVDRVKDTIVWPVPLTHMVDQQVPVYEYGTAVDPVTGETYETRTQTGTTVVQVEEPIDAGNPWKTVLDAQGAPAVVYVGPFVPDGYTPVDVT